MDAVDQPLALAPRELEALRAAAAWHAEYHASIIADEADDGSAYAVVRREEYLALIRALGKLGVRIGVPERLADRVAGRFSAGLQGADGPGCSTGEGFSGAGER